MKDRLVVLSIDDLARLFKDYSGKSSNIPEDAQCETMLLNNTERLMCLRLSSESWDGVQPTEAIRFDLQRTFPVGRG